MLRVPRLLRVAGLLRVPGGMVATLAWLVLSDVLIESISTPMGTSSKAYSRFFRFPDELAEHVHHGAQCGRNLLQKCYLVVAGDGNVERGP